MEESILTSTKKLLGINEDDETFDVDIITFINAVFADLSQLGVGPKFGYTITDKTATWDTFLGDDLNLAAVPTYMYLRVRLLFNPPDTTSAQTAFQAQADKLEFRLNVQAEGETWVPPVVIPMVELSEPI